MVVYYTWNCVKKISINFTYSIFCQYKKEKLEFIIFYSGGQIVHTIYERILVQQSTGVQCIPVRDSNSNSDSSLNFDSSDVQNDNEIDESSVDSWGN